MKVLIGFDGSACSEGALSDLKLAGLPTYVEAEVLTAANVWLPPALVPGVEPAVKITPHAVAKARQEAEEQLAAADLLAAGGATRLRELFPDWTVRSNAVADSPGCALIKRASDWNADLVVVGATGRSGLERIALGSVSQKVVTESPCSVRVVRTKRARSALIPRILIAVDGSENSSRLIETVSQRNWPSGTQVRLLTAIDEKISTSIFDDTSHVQRWIDGNDEDPLAWIARMLAEYRSILEKVGLVVDTLVNQGNPREMLIGEAEHWSADAIMIGAKGHRILERVLIGSVSTSVTARAHCTVEVVR
ncbi:MAG: universal stress protein [Acidobacteria bacterium]|nr:universal stress protein [Acidobacteriota bacterium]